jgi:hypothetical protein
MAGVLLASCASSGMTGIDGATLDRAVAIEASRGLDIARNANGWPIAIAECRPAAEFAGTPDDVAIWAYEERMLERERRPGWPSDRARLRNAQDEAREKFEMGKGNEAAAALARCEELIARTFPQGHPVTLAMR